MPRKKMSIFEKNNKAVLRAIAGQLEYKDMSKTEFCKRMNFTPQTCSNRFKDPSVMTLGELWKMLDILELEFTIKEKSSPIETQLRNIASDLGFELRKKRDTSYLNGGQ